MNYKDLRPGDRVKWINADGPFCRILYFCRGVWVNGSDRARRHMRHVKCADGLEAVVRRESDGEDMLVGRPCLVPTTSTILIHEHRYRQGS